MGLSVGVAPRRAVVELAAAIAEDVLIAAPGVGKQIRISFLHVACGAAVTWKLWDGPSAQLVPAWHSVGFTAAITAFNLLMAPVDQPILYLRENAGLYVNRATATAMNFTIVYTIEDAVAAP